MSPLAGGRLVDLDASARAGLIGARFVVGRHHLHDEALAPSEAVGLFSDESIAALLDDYPAELLFALTMGTDPERMDQNERLDHSGVRGTDLLAAVRKGRIWCNITNIDRIDSRFRALTDRLYNEISLQQPEFAATETHATLLVSSPQAMSIITLMVRRHFCGMSAATNGSGFILHSTNRFCRGRCSKMSLPGPAKSTCRTGPSSTVWHQFTISSRERSPCGPRTHRTGWPTSAT